MHRAAGVSAVDCVEALLAARADVNALHNTNRRTAMDMANASVRAILGAAGGRRSGTVGPSSRTLLPERSRRPVADGGQGSQSRRDRAAAWRAKTGGRGQQDES